MLIYRSVLLITFNRWLENLQNQKKIGCNYMRDIQATFDSRGYFQVIMNGNWGAVGMISWDVLGCNQP